MSWGGQGAFNGAHVISPWDCRERLTEKLCNLRKGGLGRSEAYNSFCGEGRVPGLGPSFFTKLLCFFGSEANFYIMDQWTSKSINLLKGRPVVRMAGHCPSAENTGDDYEAFCKEVDAVAKLLRCEGQHAEERVFSKGGRSPWPWRRYVRKTWHAQPA
jgi:hypothetical protein